MKKYIVILGLMLSNSWLFSQHEYPISNLKSLLSFLSEDSTFTFSYPADLENMQFTSILIKKSHRKDEIINIFERINLESKILNNHILLRPKQEQKSFELENEKIFKITVFDKISNEKIAWAAITTVLGTEERVYFTDDNGVAILPHNAKNIIVSQLGYESKYLSHLEDNQKIKIQPKPIALQTVEKKSFQPAYQSQQVEKSVVNYTQPFSNETVSPSSTKDVLAMVQMLPGINNTEERAGSIKIRGSNADGTNIFLNGIPVIQTGHYFELFSTINPLYVDKVELFKNNSPIHDLSNSGGAIYLSSKTLDRAKTSIKGDINLLTSSFNAFIPITPQFAITGAYRQNISDISNNSFYSINKFNPPKLVENLGQRLEEVLLRSSPTFGFYDTHMNASYKYKLGDFQASFFSIKDEYTNSIAQNQRINLNTNLFQSVMGTSTNNRDWQSLGYGLSSRINITSKFNTNIRWYSSSYDEDYLLQTTITPRTNLSKLTNKTDFSTDVKLSEISWMNQYQISSTTQWKAGVSKMSLLSLSDFSSTRNNQYTDKNELVNNTIFTQVQYQPTHYTMQSAVKLNWVANQMLIDWNALLIRSLENNVSLKFSASRSNQIMRRLNIRDIFDQSLGIWTGINQQIPPLLTHQLAAGFIFKQNNFFIDIEGYFKKMNGVAELISPQPQIREPLQELQDLDVLLGNGIVNGADILARYESNNFNTQVSYTLSKATNQIPGIFNGRSYPSIQDRTHQFKMLNTLKYNNWQLSTNHNFATGLPFFTGKIETDRRLNELLKTDAIRRLPNYIRHDLGINYQLILGSIKSQIRLDIVNLFNRQNTNNIQYLSTVRDTRSPNNIIITGTSTNMLNRTFNLGLYFEY